MKIRSHGRLGVALLLPAILLTACGGAADEPDAAASEEPAAEETEAEAEEPAEDGGESDEADASGDAASAQAVTLAFTDFYAPGSFFGDAHSWWMDQIAERTGGSVTFEPYWASSLMPPQEGLEGIGQGRADAGFLGQAYYPVALPLANAAYLPDFGTDAYAMVAAYAEMFENNTAFQEEWAKHNVTPLAWSPVTVSGLGSTSPIESVEDFQGRSIRSSGLQSIAYESWGAQTAAIASSETYEALQRGVIDGWAGLTLDGTAAMGFPEVAPHLLAFPELFAVIGAPLVMNTETWDSLEESQQQVILEVSEEYKQVAIEMAMDYEADGCDQYLAAGGTVSMFPDDQRETLVEDVADAMRDRWFETSLESGLAQEEIEAFVADLTASYERNSQDSPYTDGFVACYEKANS